MEFSERPLTIIYDRGKNLPDEVLGEDGSIGIRVTRDIFCKKLIERFRKPIVSTSANFSGSPAPASFEEIPEEIKNSADYVAQWRQDDRRAVKPSVILRMKNNGEIRFLRK